MIVRDRWWSAYPMLRIWVALATGIACYDGQHQVMALCCWLASLCISLLLVSLKFASLHSGLPRLMRKLTISLLLISTGYLLVWSHDIKKSPYWLGNTLLNYQHLLAKVITEPTGDSTNLRYMAAITAASDRGRWRTVNGKLWVQVKGVLIRKGQYFLLDAQPLEIPQIDEQAHDFFRYLHRQQVFFTVRLHKGNCHIIPDLDGQGLTSAGQHYLKTVLSSGIRDSDTRAMAGAILFGERAVLPKSITQAYVQTGVIHVIAISGMHLAIIYSLISALLKPLRQGRMKWGYCILCIALLWYYTWICGATPSVRRSAWMFSFLLWGETMQRNNSAGNNLAASGVLMLCMDPYLLWDIGFQLSYAAVASLLVYQKWIQTLWNPDHLFIRQGWNLLSTTVAAQILTTPLVLYHFGQFPLLFLMANLLAIPLSSLILLLLCGASLTYPFGLSTPMCQLAAFLIRFMNKHILALSEVKYATITDINLRLPDLINIYLVILTVTLWIRSKKR